MKPTEAMIRDELMEQIQAGHFLPETTLPSENELADFYQVSRLTIRRVYNVLVEMGYIYSKRGVGHFVMARRKPIEVALRGDTSFTEKMKQQKIPYHSKTVRCEVIPYNEKIFQALGVDKGEKVYQVVRVRTIYNKRAALHLSYLSEKKFPKIAKEGLEIESIFDYYRSKGHQVFHSHHSKLSISFPTKEERELLDCQSLTPLLTIESDCFDKETNNILEYTRIIYRSDVLELSLAKVNS